LKILFVCSGNKKTEIVPIIKAQGDSLKKNGVEIIYFTIKGKGIKGYLKNIAELKKYLSTEKVDIIHAHYSLSAIVASLANLSYGIPQVTSLMGSDVNSSALARLLIKIFHLFFWDITIVKSEFMKNKINLKNVEIIPNGVNLQSFYPQDKREAKEKIGFDLHKKYIVWISNPARYSKHWELADQAFQEANLDNVVLQIVNNISHKDIPNYLNAADLLLLSSRWEGSPNVVKEAMACNLPIVSTDVGDVKQIIQDTENCYIVPQDHKKMAVAIKKSLEKDKKTSGREKIKFLDDNLVAKKIIALYKNLI